MPVATKKPDNFSDNSLTEPIFAKVSIGKSSQGPGQELSFKHFVNLDVVIPKLFAEVF